MEGCLISWKISSCDVISRPGWFILYGRKLLLFVMFIKSSTCQNWCKSYEEIDQIYAKIFCSGIGIVNLEESLLKMHRV